MSYAMFTGQPQNFGGGGSFLGIDGDVAASSIAGFGNFNNLWQSYLTTKKMEADATRQFNYDNMAYPLLRSLTDNQMRAAERERARYAPEGLYANQDQLDILDVKDKIEPYAFGTNSNINRTAAAIANMNRIFAERQSTPYQNQQPAPFSLNANQGSAFPTTQDYLRPMPQIQGWR